LTWLSLRRARGRIRCESDCAFQIPTIVITADYVPVNAAAHGNAGRVAWLQKPVSGDALLSAIQQAVRGSDPIS
jgi:CheY-like chemotaxis protein